MGTETCKPKRPVSVVHFPGTDDEHAPFKGGKDVSKVVLVVIEGGGHTWPGQEPSSLQIPEGSRLVTCESLLGMLNFCPHCARRHLTLTSLVGVL
jgi:poly(3-hydroxybutyrate) depolymerase